MPPAGQKFKMEKNLNSSRLEDNILVNSAVHDLAELKKEGSHDLRVPTDSLYGLI